MKPTTRAIRDLLTAARGEWVAMTVLDAVGGDRYGGRIHELRAAGYVIEQQGSGKKSRYRLTSGPPSPYETLRCSCGWEGVEPHALRDLDGPLCPRCVQPVGTRQMVLVR